MARFLALGMLVIATACAQLPRPDGAVPAKLSATWLVGGWVPEGQSCESDAGVIYRGDGTWSAYGVGGSWRIEGSAIVILVTADEENPKVSVAKPGKHIEQIKVLGPDAYETRWDDGTVLRLRRCRPARG